MTWAPGEQTLIRDKLIKEGGWISKPDVTTVNLYRPPIIQPREGDASPWLDHIAKIYPEDHGHIVSWLAHRVQRPQKKINHALVLGGGQGIGKDSLLEPVKHAVGPWNFKEVSPQQLLGRFNGFAKCVVMRVSEVRDLGEADRYAFYEHTKVYTAAPPDVLRVDEKFTAEHDVLNVMGCILTTNYKTGGIYLPEDDRRHFVAWSDQSKDDFPEEYWVNLHGWYDAGGNQIVAAHLHSRDISSFNPKAAPPKTAAFYEMVNASLAPETAQMADALDDLGNPPVVRLNEITSRATDAAFIEWINDRKNRRALPHRLEECGYIPLRNGGAGDGLWKIDGKRQVIYCKRDISSRDAVVEARLRYRV